MTRIQAATRVEFPDDLVYVWDRLMAEGGTPGSDKPLNFMVALANSPGLLRAYARFLNATWEDCALDDRTRELVILRCAWLSKSRYIWQHHVDVARSVGVGQAQMLAAMDLSRENLDDLQQTVLPYVDAVIADSVEDDDVAQLSRLVGSRGVVGITMLISFYLMTARLMGALDVTTDHPFSGFDV
jgi:4-carboxymuconolactone decarboxylase